MSLFSQADHAMPHCQSDARLVLNTLYAKFGNFQRKSPAFLAFRVAAVASKSAIGKLEASWARRLPSSLAEVYANIASYMEYSWMLSHPFTSSNVSVPVQSGHVIWNIDKFLEYQRDKHAYSFETVFEECWNDWIPFASMGTGEYLAVPVAEMHQARVGLLRPAEPPECVTIFDCSAIDFLADWAAMGCITDIPLLQFYAADQHRLDTGGAAAADWINWLNS